MAETGIKFYRERKGMTQAVLAKAVGTDPGRMSRIETGAEIPTAKEVDLLVDVLEQPPARLFSKHILGEVADRARITEANVS